METQNQEVQPIKKQGISTVVGIIIIIAVALILFGGVFAYQYYFVKNNIANPTVLSETRAADLAVNAAINAKITTLSKNCISLSTSSKNTETITFEIREVHGGACGGDSSTAPIITTAEVNLRNGQVSFPEQIQADLTAGWKTYTNAQNGYQIKYPNNFQVSERTDYSFFSDPNNQANFVLQILSYPAINNQTLRDYVNQFNISMHGCSSGNCPRFNVINSGDTIVDGHNAIEENILTDGGNSISTYFKKENSTLWIFSIATPENINKMDLTQKDIDAYHQMLSTFKFTTPTAQTSNSKTYTNTQYGFSLSYPADFINTDNVTTAQQSSLMTYMGVCLVGNNSRIQPNEIGFCYIGKQTSDGFDMASLNITPSASISMQDCQNSKPNGPDGEITPTQQTTINGIIFYKAQLGDAGLGHYVSTGSYRTYHQGVCYTIDLNIESNRGISENGLSADFSSMMRSRLESILSTFKFTK